MVSSNCNVVSWKDCTRSLFPMVPGCVPEPLKTMAGKKVPVTPAIPKLAGRFTLVGLEKPSVTGKYEKPARASLSNDDEKVWVSSITNSLSGKVLSEAPSNRMLLLLGAVTNCCDQRPMRWSLSEGM